MHTRARRVDPAVPYVAPSCSPFQARVTWPARLRRAPARVVRELEVEPRTSDENAGARLERCALPRRSALTEVRHASATEP